jgi:hypothetical protein
MRSIRHWLKTCEKTLYNAKKFTIKANMDHYHLPLPIMNVYFKQVTPPKATSDLESGEYLLNKLTKFKKNGCKIFVIEYNPIDDPSEVQNKMIIMGHQVSSCHVPVVRSFFIL